MRPVTKNDDTNDTAKLIRSMLPTLRDEFRSLLPVPETPAPTELHYRLRKVNLGSIKSRAEVLAPKLGLEHDDAAYHIIGTTRALFHDLQSYFETAAAAGAPQKARELCTRQNTLYRTMDAFKPVEEEPLFFDTQLIVSHHIGRMVPAEPKKPVFGFGN